MTKKIDDIWNFIDETTSCGCTSSPTSDEIICEIRKWADSIPEFMQNNRDELPFFPGPDLDKDFCSDKIGIRALSDSMPLCIKPSLLTLGFYA